MKRVALLIAVVMLVTPLAYLVPLIASEETSTATLLAEVMLTNTSDKNVPHPILTKIVITDGEVLGALSNTTHLRIKDSLGFDVPFYLEKWDSDEAIIWVVLPSFPRDIPQKLYLYEDKDVVEPLSDPMIFYNVEEYSPYGYFPSMWRYDAVGNPVERFLYLETFNNSSVMDIPGYFTIHTDFGGSRPMPWVTPNIQYSWDSSGALYASNVEQAYGYITWGGKLGNSYNYLFDVGYSVDMYAFYEVWFKLVSPGGEAGLGLEVYSLSVDVPSSAYGLFQVGIVRPEYDLFQVEMIVPTYGLFQVGIKDNADGTCTVSVSVSTTGEVLEPLDSVVMPWDATREWHRVTVYYVGNNMISVYFDDQYALSFSVNDIGITLVNVDWFYPRFMTLLLVGKSTDVMFDNLKAWYYPETTWGVEPRDIQVTLTPILEKVSLEPLITLKPNLNLRYDASGFKPGYKVKVGKITITNNWNKMLADTPVRVVITDPNILSMDPKYIRVMDVLGRDYMFAIEEWSPTRGVIWVKVNTLPSGDTLTLYLYEDRNLPSQDRPTLMFNLGMTKFNIENLWSQVSYDDSPINPYHTYLNQQYDSTMGALRIYCSDTDPYYSGLAFDRFRYGSDDWYIVNQMLSQQTGFIIRVTGKDPHISNNTVWGVAIEEPYTANQLIAFSVVNLEGMGVQEINFTVYNGYNATNTSKLFSMPYTPDTEWHNLTMAYYNGVFKLYFDDVYIGSVNYQLVDTGTGYTLAILTGYDVPVEIYVKSIIVTKYYDMENVTVNVEYTPPSEELTEESVVSVLEPMEAKRIPIGMITIINNNITSDIINKVIKIYSDGYDYLDWRIDEHYMYNSEIWFFGVTKYLEIVDENGNRVPFWVEAFNIYDLTIWVNTTIPAGGMKTLYLVYNTSLTEPLSNKTWALGSEDYDTNAHTNPDVTIQIHLSEFDVLWFYRIFNWYLKNGEAGLAKVIVKNIGSERLEGVPVRIYIPEDRNIGGLSMTYSMFGASLAVRDSEGYPVPSIVEYMSSESLAVWVNITLDPGEEKELYLVMKARPQQGTVFPLVIENPPVQQSGTNLVSNGSETNPLASESFILSFRVCVYLDLYDQYAVVAMGDRPGSAYVQNGYYVKLDYQEESTTLVRVVNGTTYELAKVYTLPPKYSNTINTLVTIIKYGNSIEVRFDGKPIIKVVDQSTVSTVPLPYITWDVVTNQDIGTPIISFITVAPYYDVDSVKAEVVYVTELPEEATPATTPTPTPTPTPPPGEVSPFRWDYVLVGVLLALILVAVIGSLRASKSVIEDIVEKRKQFAKRKQ